MNPRDPRLNRDLGLEDLYPAESKHFEQVMSRLEEKGEL